MTRRCGWCSAPGREEWERRVMGGEPISMVVSSTPFSSSAAQRHMRLHAQRSVLDDMRTSAASQLHSAEFADRLLELTDEAAEIQASAADPRTKLRAVREQRENLSVLLTRLGVDSEESIDALREARALGAGVSAVLRNHPGVAAELARQFTEDGQPELSDAFRRLAGSATVRLASPDPKELAS